MKTIKITENDRQFLTNMINMILTQGNNQLPETEKTKLKDLLRRVNK